MRRLEAHEVHLHRDVRLRALREAPDSFADAFTEAGARPISYWEDLTQSVTEPGRHVMFLACHANHVAGSVYGLLDRERSEAGRVGSMWVDPDWRRRGIGGALLQAVFGWARERGMSRLGLWAPGHSPAALALYRSAGFQETGRRRPLTAHSPHEIVEMESMT